jgi:hypothetical protein
MANKKNIINYTSETPSSNSIQRIEEMIISLGARQISKIYNGFGSLSGIKFVLPINNMMLTFDMDAKVDLVYEKMLKNYVKTPNSAQRASCKNQAEHTDWKNMQELLQIQLDMIELNQYETMQALFLSLSDGTETVFEKMKKSNFKALLPEHVK